MLSNLLNGVPQPTIKGRVVRFGISEPGIKFVTGSMHDRVQACLEHNKESLTASEIAIRIASTPSRVTISLQRLINQGKAQKIVIDGCVTEYIAEVQ